MSDTHRILTTHVGSLPRPAAVVDVVGAQDRGEPVDPGRLDQLVTDAVTETVRRQVQTGIDLVGDGEMSKVGYATYVRHRLSGFELSDVPPATPADLEAFPRFRDRLGQRGDRPRHVRPVCRAAVAYEHREPLEDDIARLRMAITGQPIEGAFLNAPSPGVVALFHPNEYYATPEDYLDAIAAAMRTEYEAIVAAGFYLQIDAPDLAMGRRHYMNRDRTDAEFVELAARQVHAINDALRDVPSDRVRLHVCWGNYEGPHHLDIPVEQIIDVILAAKPATLMFEAANPRHAHEWTVWRDAAIPDDKILAPGVLDSTTNYIEHPELVAQRLASFVDIVGPERVVAATDCGLATWAGFGPIDPDIGWAKLGSLVAGTRLANARVAAGTVG